MALGSMSALWLGSLPCLASSLSSSSCFKVILLSIVYYGQLFASLYVFQELVLNEAVGYRATGCWLERTTRAEHSVNAAEHIIRRGHLKVQINQERVGWREV